MLAVSLKLLLAWQFPFHVLFWLISAHYSMHCWVTSGFKFRLMSIFLFNLLEWSIYLLCQALSSFFFFWHCAPLQSRSTLVTAFTRFVFDTAYKKKMNKNKWIIKKQNPCFALSDQCGNGSNPNSTDEVDNGIDAAAKRTFKCHTEHMCSC